MTDIAYEGWALIEQMGFRSTIAKVREVEQFGTKMIRLEVPFWENGTALLSERAPDGWTTRFAGGPSLYQVSPMDEELALHMARQQSDPRPVRPTTFRIPDMRARDTADYSEIGPEEDEQ
jgi:hypothetical protein